MARDPEAGKPKPRKRSSSASKQSLSWRDVREILLHESHENIVTALLEWAEEDKALRDRVLNFAARRAGPEAAVAEAARAVEKAIGKPGRRIAQREAREWTRTVNRAIDNIEQLLVEGHSAAVLELCERSLKHLVNAAPDGLDDSDDHVTGLCERLEALHLEACERSGPDPVALARRLFEYETTLDFDVFSNAVARYQHLLQADGLREFRRLAEAAWAKVPARTGKGSDTFITLHLRIERIMQELARASGDREELVAVLSRDLSQPQGYAEIATVYQQANDLERALEWVERGLKSFPNQRSSALPGLAIELFHQLGRHEDAMNAVWAQFVESAQPNSFQYLRDHAEKVGAWPYWRERALAEIRSRIAQEKGKVNLWTPFASHSVLVEIFLAEGDTEAAWREAKIGNCSPVLWARLAQIREKTHPAEAGAVYLKLAENGLAIERDGHYEGILQFLLKAAKLMRAAGRNREFLTALYGFSTKYRLKRNFMKLVNENHKALFGE